MAQKYKSKTTKKFWTLFDKLPRDVQTVAKDAYKMFCADPNHPGLNFERLSSNRDICTVRINKQYRAVGIYGKPIMWFWIGTHQEFDNTY